MQTGWSSFISDKRENSHYSVVIDLKKLTISDFQTGALTMEKGDLTTGQLLSIKEKNGKLVREYVAGFFGEEPIIKQRLLTPQEARRYREDMSRARSEGKRFQKPLVLPDRHRLQEPPKNVWCVGVE